MAGHPGARPSRGRGTGAVVSFVFAFLAAAGAGLGLLVVHTGNSRIDQTTNSLAEIGVAFFYVLSTVLALLSLLLVAVGLLFRRNVHVETRPGRGRRVGEVVSFVLAFIAGAGAGFGLLVIATAKSRSYPANHAGYPWSGLSLSFAYVLLVMATLVSLLLVTVGFLFRRR